MKQFKYVSLIIDFLIMLAVTGWLIALWWIVSSVVGLYQ